MQLTEQEGKALLKTGRVTVPPSVIISTSTSKEDVQQRLDGLEYPVFVKAQVLHGNRELLGLVKKAETKEGARAEIERILQLKDAYDQPITSVSVESSIEEYDQEMYLAIRYDTRLRKPVISFSKQGGAGMDHRGESISNIPFTIGQPVETFTPFPKATQLVQQLIQIFLNNDATLLEINPLVRVGEEWYCLDAKIELEDTAAFRHPEWERYPQRSDLGRPPTEIELQAHKVSKQDHRGVAGESFFQFEGGTIGVMASGGGASTLAMDALMAEGLKPANYTEYSGNPTREKVAALADVVLSMPNLEALYVVGSTANFTDIYETLAGLFDGFLRSPYAKKENFVILIRRGGPRWKEAFEMVRDRMKKYPARVLMYGPDFPLVQTASKLAEILDSIHKGNDHAD